MATLIELRNFADDSILRNKIDTAVALCIHLVLSGQDNGPPFSQVVGDHDKRIIWAMSSLGNLKTQTNSFVELVLSKNSAVSVGTIEAAITSNAESGADPIKDFVCECVDLVSGVTI